METVGVEPNGIDAKTFILRHFCVSVSISVSIIKKRAMPDRSQTPPPQEENRHSDRLHPAAAVLLETYSYSFQTLADPGRACQFALVAWSHPAVSLDVDLIMQILAGWI